MQTTLYIFEVWDLSDHFMSAFVPSRKPLKREYMYHKDEQQEYIINAIP